MVKRGGKEVITVEIFKETYDTMKAIATKKHWSTKNYINNVSWRQSKETSSSTHMLPRCQKWVMKITFCLFETQSLAKLQRSLFETAPFTVMYVIPRTVSIFTTLLPCQKWPSCICIDQYLKLEQGDQVKGRPPISDVLVVILKKIRNLISIYQNNLGR